MNKTIIALAIAAALPVAAQADATISGSVGVEYTQGGVITTDAAVSLASSEVLANGMTATASLDVLGGDSQGTATLAGDFGTLTVGSMDSDGAFQAGDVGGVVGDSEDADEDGTSVNGIHFSGIAAGLSVAAQLNGSTDADGTTANTDGTQLSATYDFNGLSAGYSYASASASNDTTTGLTAAQTAFGVSYSFGDLTVTAGKSSTAADAVISATYTTTMDALTVSATANNSSDLESSVSYTLDGITITAGYDSTDSVTPTDLSASFTSGNMTVTANSDSEVTAALDLGNADLAVSRDSGATSMTYTVAF